MKNKKAITYLKDYTPPCYLIDHADLTFTISSNKVEVKSILSFSKNPKARVSTSQLFLNGVNLKLIYISLNKKKLESSSFKQTENGLILYGPPEKFTLETFVEIDPYQNTSLEGMYGSGDILCTQNEAEGFRKITFFLDRSDVMASFRTTLIAEKDKYPTLLAGGNLIEEKSLSGNLHLKTYEDPAPKPCYLFALVAGKLNLLASEYTTLSKKKIRLELYTEREETQTLKFALDSLKKAMRWDEEVFGLEYDLKDYRIVAVEHFNFGAMENKGLNIFNSSLIIADAQKTTDLEQEYIEAVIAHEYFHNWSGNRITLRDWFQLTLKEGLTVFRDQEFTSDMRSGLVKRISDVKMMRSSQFREDQSPLAHPIQPSFYRQINNFYTLTIYEKGAEVVRMYKTLLGRENFMKALSIYFKRFDGMAITVDDFFDVMQECEKTDISQFKRWYSTKGTPKIDVQEEFSPETGDYQIHLRQSIAHPDQDKADPLMIPLNYTLYSSIDNSLSTTDSGRRGEATNTVLKKGTLVCTTKSQSFSFSESDLDWPSSHKDSGNKVKGFAKPLLSINQGFSAPIIVEQKQTTDEIFNLLLVEKDGFNCWDLIQKVYIQAYFDYKNTKKFFLDERYSKALANLLKGEKDLSFVASCLTPPSIQQLVSFETHLDFDLIYQFEKHYFQYLKQHLQADYLGTYDKLNTAQNNLPTSTQARALKNTLLLSLVKMDSQYEEKAVEQQKHALNMTDEYSALHALSLHYSKVATDALQKFYEKWNHDSLVLNKWFSASARMKNSPLTANTNKGENPVLEHIERLTHHEKYDMKEPNKVNSLLMVFAFHNYQVFHHASGSGYTFLAEKITEMDKLNPTVSARLITSFGYYQKLSPTQKKLALSAMLTIQENVQSNAAKEIIDNILSSKN